MNVRLYPCDYVPEKNGEYYSETVFELSSWCGWVLKDVIPNSKPITFPIRVPWVNKTEYRSLDNIDHESTWLIEAWVLKTMKFHEDSWHPSRIIRSHAISAYFKELPDDWPVVVYYV